MKGLYHLKFILAFVLCSVLYSCKDDQVDPGLQCEGLVLEFGPYELSDTTRNRFPYTDEIERLVFVDVTGTEFNFNLDHFGTSISNFVYDNVCPYDTAQDVSYVLNQEAITAIFVCDTLGLRLNFDFSAYARLSDTTVIAESDVLNLNIIRNGVGFSTALRFSLLHKYGIQLIPAVDPLSTVTINQRLFTTVYTQPLGEIMFQEWIAYYNDEYGIVGLEHAIGSPKLSLKRVE